MDHIERVENTEPSSIYNAVEESVRYDESALPNLVVRIKAFFIDLLILLLIFAGVSVIIDAVGNVSSIVRGSVAVFMFYLYDPLLTAFTGGTIGHKVMKLKIKRFQDSNRNISLVAAIIRFLVKTMLGWLSFFTVTGNTNKRAIHDLISGAVMLKK